MQSEFARLVLIDAEIRIAVNIAISNNVGGVKGSFEIAIELFSFLAVRQSLLA